MSYPEGSQPSSPPPGWYPQPNGIQRYWDGTAWTEHTAPAAPHSGYAHAGTATEPATSQYSYGEAPHYQGGSPYGGGSSAPTYPGSPTNMTPAGGSDLKQQRKWFQKKRIILPALGAVITLAVVFALGGFDSKPDSAPTAGPTNESTQEPPNASDDSAPAETEAPDPAGPSPTTPQEPPAGPPTDVQAQAMAEAELILGSIRHSRLGIIEVLVRNGYSEADATFAVDYLDLDWNERALDMAQNYIDKSTFSRVDLINQLEYEKLTDEQITYAMDNITVDWNEEAVEQVEKLIEFFSWGREEITGHMAFMGFTDAQIEYGLKAAGL